MKKYNLYWKFKNESLHLIAKLECYDTVAERIVELYKTSLKDEKDKEDIFFILEEVK